jgi:hypothetical protein
LQQDAKSEVHTVAFSAKMITFWIKADNASHSKPDVWLTTKEDVDNAHHSEASRWTNLESV